MPYVHELELFSSVIQALSGNCHHKDITLPFFLYYFYLPVEIYASFIFVGLSFYCWPVPFNTSISQCLFIFTVWYVKYKHMTDVATLPNLIWEKNWVIYLSEFKIWFQLNLVFFSVNIKNWDKSWWPSFLQFFSGLYWYIIRKALCSQQFCSYYHL